MCGLFGYSSYGDSKIDLYEITNSLAKESAERGTDATGIAYNTYKNVNVVKMPKSAYKITFDHPKTIHALIGHTRHSTQGSEKRNYNNHPFFGKAGMTKFALAHNGVLINDDILKTRYKLPKTRIQTDSYVAVQLLEHKKVLNMDSIKFMAESIQGSFSFSILDERNNVYLVKGDSPLSLIHFPKLKFYAYASTDEILWKGLIDTDLFEHLKNNEYEQIKISGGDILKICADGTIKKDTFDYCDYSFFGGCDWRDYDISDENVYIENLKAVAYSYGYEPEDVDELHNNGFTCEEIEDYLCEKPFYECMEW